jgi:hypothetical protein
MAEELFAIGYDAPASLEFIGFESAPAQGVVENRQTEPPVMVKPRRRRSAKLRKQTHPVRVWFDDRELGKLNSRAGAAGVTVPEYVRVRALRDPRARGRQAAPGEDLFARADPARAKLRSGRLPPQLEKRINTYYSAESGAGAEPARARAKMGDASGRPKILARLSHFLTELVGSRMHGHRAAPGTGA